VPTIMIAEKASDMIKGHRLEPFEPEPAKSEASPTRRRRAVDLRYIKPEPQAPLMDELAKSQYDRLIYNQYGSSALADGIMRKML